MAFFALGGFLVLEEMEKEQRELDDEDIEATKSDMTPAGHIEMMAGGGDDESEDRLTDGSFDAQIELRNEDKRG